MKSKVESKKTILKNISPFNNITDMPAVLFCVKKILAFWFCYIAGLIIAEGAVILIHFASGKNMLVGDVFGSQTITLIMYYGYIVIIGVVLLYWKLIEKKSLSEIGLKRQISSYFVGMAIALILLLASVCIIILTGNMEYHGLFKNINILIVLLFFGGFIVQGAMEELLCRGFLLHSLKEKVSLPIAVAISTVMFIIPHWSSLFAGQIIYGIVGIGNLVLISIIFSILTIRLKNIWAACGIHSFWNFILYSVLGLNLSGSDENAAAIFNMKSVGKNVINGGLYGIEASVITTVILGVFVILCVYRKNEKQQKK